MDNDKEAAAPPPAFASAVSAALEAHMDGNNPITNEPARPPPVPAAQPNVPETTVAPSGDGQDTKEVNVEKDVEMADAEQKVEMVAKQEPVVEPVASRTHILQAVINGKQIVSVKVKANNEVVLEDSLGGSETARSFSSSTNTSTIDREEEEYETLTEDHHHKHRTRSSSFDIAQAMVSNAIDNNNYTPPPANIADASLLLGLTTPSHTSVGASKPTRGELEPATLPSTMTFFLDMLNEEQRRVRHRHIPNVEGFRKLYKSEIKADLVASRAMKTSPKDVMDIDQQEEAENTAEEADKTHPDTNAFISPSENTIAFAHCGQLASLMESTPFENSMRGGLSSSSLRSPQLVESLTAFNPPRPQESTALKTQHRLKRWEANPDDVEVDLTNYKKTVSRTRMELHKAEEELVQIEAVAGLMRTQFYEHLNCYKEEIGGMGDELRGVMERCFKVGEVYNGKGVSTRGGGKSMRDVFGTLRYLGEELGTKGVVEDRCLEDWRVSGVGGILGEGQVVVVKDGSPLANGWILVGDKVKTPSGEEGTVVKFAAPCLGPPEKAADPNAMDVDKPKKEADASSSLDNVVTPATVEVQLANGTVKTFSPSELKLQNSTFSCTKDSDLAKRWESMTQTALDIGSGHDYLGMNSQVVASLLRKEEQRQQEENNDGSVSPKSVVQYDDLRNLVPFGAGIMSAPQQIRDFSSVIPVSTLENTVRKVVYESGKDVQVIPEVPPSVEKYESQKENLNKLKIKVLQLRNRLGRQKKIRSLNEHSLKAGEKRADRVEELLMEMQTDLSSLKGRLQDELNDLGIGNAANGKTTDTNTEIANELVDNADDGKTTDTNTEIATEQKEVPPTNAEGADTSNLEEQPTDTPKAEEQPTIPHETTAEQPIAEKRSLDDGEDPENKRARLETNDESQPDV